MSTVTYILDAAMSALDLDACPHCGSNKIRKEKRSRVKDREAGAIVAYKCNHGCPSHWRTDDYRAELVEGRRLKHPITGAFRTAAYFQKVIDPQHFISADTPGTRVHDYIDHRGAGALPDSPGEFKASDYTVGRLNNRVKDLIQPPEHRKAVQRMLLKRGIITKERQSGPTRDTHKKGIHGNIADTGWDFGESVESVIDEAILSEIGFFGDPNTAGSRIPSGGARGDETGTSGRQRADNRSKQPSCRNCGLVAALGAAQSCPRCGYGADTSYVTSAGANGQNTANTVGFASVSGGPISTQESTAKFRVRYLGGSLVEVDYNGSPEKVSLDNVHDSLLHRMRLHPRRTFFMGQIGDWLYNEAEPGQEYIIDFTNDAHYINGPAGLIDYRGGR